MPAASTNAPVRPGGSPSAPGGPPRSTSTSTEEAKQYGTCRLAEGADVAGRRVLVVEDVVTSGGQVVLSAADLRGLGAQVAQALCVIDRGQGGADALAAAGIGLVSLLTADELRAAAG